MGSKRGGKKRPIKFTIDCSEPANDQIMDVSGLEKFLHDRIKIAGKTGNLGDTVKITTNEKNVVVTAQPPFSKRYLKYLTREYLRIVASQKSRNAYQIKYFNIEAGSDNEEE